MITYGIKTLKAQSPSLYAGLPEKVYTLRDLFWAVPLGMIVLALSAFLVWFYWTFPIQLIWLVPSVFGLLLILIS